MIQLEHFTNMYIISNFADNSTFSMQIQEEFIQILMSDQGIKSLQKCLKYFIRLQY